MDAEEAVKAGFLLIPYQSFLWKTWTKRFCALYNSSNCGIKRIEIFDSEDDYVKLSTSKIIPLADCIKVSSAPQKQQANVFEVRTKDNMQVFSAESFQDMTDWLAALQNVAFGETLKSHPVPLKDEKQEENLLYSSMDEPELFPVKTVPTEASLRNNLTGDYKLVVTAVNIAIAEEASHGNVGKIICTWPYRHIRRYGYTTESFSFEAGRKCSSGEGIFTFSTNNSMIVFQSIDSHVSALKSSRSESEMPNSFHFKEGNFNNKDLLMSKEDSFHSYSDFLRMEFEKSSNESKTLKTSTPVSKPPRKSKPSKIANDTNSTDKFDAENVSSKTSQFYGRSDVYSNQNSLGNASSFDNFKQQYTAFRGYGPSDFSEVEKISKSNSSIASEPSTDESNNCDLLLSRFSTLKSENVYGKVMSNRVSLQTKESARLSDHAVLKHSSSTGSFVIPLTSKKATLKKDSINASYDGKMNPNHFLKNDSEYAQIFK